MSLPKKLIEVALPLDAINKASAREKSIRYGHPSTLHLWWARRPLAAARAVIFAQMVDDPSSHPELFPTEELQEQERQRLFKVIEDLVQWETTNNETVLDEVRYEVWKSWRATCDEHSTDSSSHKQFNPDSLPVFYDPFAGGGSLPLEAQRLGLESFASDLNPVAVLINKAMIEIPPRFAGRPPVNPQSRSEQSLVARDWRGTRGLSDDVAYYGRWIRDEAEKRIGHLYPKVEITEEMAHERPDLEPLVGKKLTVIAWLWARTVKSPNPAFADVAVPLVSTFMLGTKPGKEIYVSPIVDGTGYHFTVKLGKPTDVEGAKSGTKLAGANFRCLISGAPIPDDYIKAEGQAGRLGVRLMAVVAEGERGRVYLSPTADMEAIAEQARPEWSPPGEVPARMTGGTCVPYGMKDWGDLFTARQLVALTTLADLVKEAFEQVKHDAFDMGLPDAADYAMAIATYLGLIVGRVADYSSTICTWSNSPKNELVRGTFARQALPMTWDFAEANPFGPSSGSIDILVGWVAKAIDRLPTSGRGTTYQRDATKSPDLPQGAIISTDPPYFNNIGYADLSDYFYVWLRRSLKPIFPDLFAMLATPKAEELVATPHRHGSKEKAEAFFMDGMTRAMRQLADETLPGFPVTIYYAFKQSETDSEEGTSSTGWETFLQAVIQAGFAVTGTWPIRTERSARSVGIGTNALASSIVLVCRPRSVNATAGTRREFINLLKAELPGALAHLQHGNIAPVDLAQAAIGPGMAVYTRFVKVLGAEGTLVSVREALALINQTLDEVLAQQEGDFDPDTRWAVAWFEQFGFTEGQYGIAETLSKAKNTSIHGLQSGILASKGGKVRLFQPADLRSSWDPGSDLSLSAWEIVHHLIRVLEARGEGAAAELMVKLGTKADIARELAYRLYTVCERRKWAREAVSYNGLVQSWPEIVRLAGELGIMQPAQTEMFGQV